MAPLPRIQSGAGPHAPLEMRLLSTDPVSAAALDVYTVGATIPLPGLGETAGGSSYWLSTIRDASIWEVSLIVVLFLMITALVGVRVVQSLSTRKLGSAVQYATSDSSGSQHASGSAHANPADPESDSDQPRSYENVVSADTPPELLSDEGRVVRLLVKHGGQIRQHQIADETGWSKSKVSRILSSMYEDGTIEKTSVGRENVISLPDRPLGETTTSTTTDNPNNPVP